MGQHSGEQAMIDMLSFGADQTTYETRLSKVFSQLQPNGASGEQGEQEHDMSAEIGNV